MNLLTLLFALSIAFAFYTADGSVTVLTESNFDSLVLNGQDVWMVEFYAPWCGHCKAMKDDWIKAADSMTGIVKFGAVDSTVEQKLAQKYAVEGFPTIKVFSPAKKSPMEFSEGRDAKSFAKVAFAAARELVNARLSGAVKITYNGNKPGKKQDNADKAKKQQNTDQQKQQQKPKDDDAVVRLTAEDITDKVLKSAAVWMVLMCDSSPACVQFTSTFSKSATALKGKAQFGSADVTHMKELYEALESKDLPAVFSFAGGEKTMESVVQYSGPKTVEGITEYVANLVSDFKAEQSKPVTIREITSESEFKSTCMEVTCLLLLVPHIYDAKADKRQEMLQLMQTVVNAQPKGMFRFGWVVGGSQIEFEQKLNYGAGYPAVFAIAGAKNRFAVHTGTFTEPQISLFIRGLQSGRVATSVLPTLPPFVKQEPWDGKDMVVEDEDEDEV